MFLGHFYHGTDQSRRETHPQVLAMATCHGQILSRKNALFSDDLHQGADQIDDVDATRKTLMMTKYYALHLTRPRTVKVVADWHHFLSSSRKNQLQPEIEVSGAVDPALACKVNRYM